MTEDIFDNLQKEVKTESVKKALESLLERRKVSPKDLEDLRNKYILKL